jgi:uncharacterized protein
VTLFNLRTARLRSGEEFRDTLPVKLEPLELGGQHYLPAPESPEAELVIGRATSGTLFRLSFDTSLVGPCVRCLGDAVIRTRVDAIEYQAQSPDSEELRTPYLVDDRLDLSAWARDAIVLSLPDKILCREDCAGLCAGCGANLNQEPCTCPPPEPEARFAKLAELRDRLGS